MRKAAGVGMGCAGAPLRRDRDRHRPALTPPSPGGRGRSQTCVPGGVGRWSRGFVWGGSLALWGWMRGLALRDALTPAGEGCWGFCTSHRASLEACSSVLLFGRGEGIASGHSEAGVGSSSAAKSVVSVFTSPESVEASGNLWRISGVVRN